MTGERSRLQVAEEKWQASSEQTTLDLLHSQTRNVIDDVSRRYLRLVETEFEFVARRCHNVWQNCCCCFDDDDGTA